MYNDKVETRKVRLEIEIEYQVINKYGYFPSKEETDRIATNLALNSNFATIEEGVFLSKIKAQGEPNENGVLTDYYGDSSINKLVATPLEVPKQ